MIGWPHKTSNIYIYANMYDPITKNTGLLKQVYFIFQLNMLASEAKIVNYYKGSNWQISSKPWINDRLLIFRGCVHTVLRKKKLPPKLKYNKVCPRLSPLCPRRTSLFFKSLGRVHPVLRTIFFCYKIIAWSWKVLCVPFDNLRL